MYGSGGMKPLRYTAWSSNCRDLLLREIFLEECLCQCCLGTSPKHQRESDHTGVVSTAYGQIQILRKAIHTVQMRQKPSKQTNRIQDAPSTSLGTVSTHLSKNKTKEATYELAQLIKSRSYVKACRSAPTRTLRYANRPACNTAKRPVVQTCAVENLFEAIACVH